MHSVPDSRFGTHSLGSKPQHLNNLHLTPRNISHKDAQLAYSGLCSIADITSVPERRSANSIVEKERRKGYFATTPDFVARAESARIHAMGNAAALSDMQFSEASLFWLEQKRIYNRESTILCYTDYITRLNKFFGALVLKEIHIGHIQEYQRIYRKQYHPASVNHDINTVSQILRKAGLWTPIAEHYRPLPLPEADSPKVMSESEEERFFEFASKNPEWSLAYLVASLTNNSTASGKELRMLQLQSIDMEAEQPHFRVPKNMKNQNRPRIIPLNERGSSIMAQLMERARGLGSTRPEHYLFPFRVKRNFFDPTRPASESWIRFRWKLLVDAAIEAKIISFRIKPHNLRHQAITKLLDYGVPIETVRQIAGHGVDSIVTRMYHHGRMEVMARAMEVIDPDRKKPMSNFPQKSRKGELA